MSDSATISRSLSAGIVLIEQVTGLYFTNEVNQDPGKWVQTLLSGLGCTHGVWYQTSAVILAKLLWQIIDHRPFISILCYESIKGLDYLGNVLVKKMLYFYFYNKRLQFPDMLFDFLVLANSSSNSFNNDKIIQPLKKGENNQC